MQPHNRLIPVWAALLLLLTGCDHGLSPPPAPPLGAIRGVVTYLNHPASWPPPAEVRDLRFVGMRFVPRDTADFLQLNRMVISERLRYGVARDTFLIPDVAAGPILFSGVAQQFAADILAWRPVGLYTDNDGIFDVRPGDTTHIAVTVDFDHPPPFPPVPASVQARTPHP